MVMVNKKQMIEALTNALMNIKNGEQIVNILDDDDEHVAFSMELDSWRGNEYYIFGLKGYSDGVELDNILYMMLGKEFFEKKIIDELGGVEKAVNDFANALFEKTESKPDEEGVPAE